MIVFNISYVFYTFIPCELAEHVTITTNRINFFLNQKYNTYNHRTRYINIKASNKPLRLRNILYLCQYLTFYLKENSYCKI